MAFLQEAFNLFGFKIGKDKGKIEQIKATPSFALPDTDDGAVVIESGGVYGTYVDMEGVTRNEADLISKYREMSVQAEVDRAVREIVNEAIVTDDETPTVAIDLDKLNYTDTFKKNIEEEFDNVLSFLDFSNNCTDIFRRWYVDGRLYYHIIINPSHPRDGIAELRMIDPRRIKKVREVAKMVDPKLNVEVIGTVNEYFVYNEMGLDNTNVAAGIKIAPDSIAYIHSGMQEEGSAMILSHLHKAIKPVNQLRMVEDATVIYRLSRAPERRVFYIDVGSLPKQKAEQYLKDIMERHRNKLVYDSVTGDIRDDKKYMSFMEDYWLPRREGGRGTEITTLPGGENLGEMADVVYFQEKLYQSLNVPIGRLKPDAGFSLGRAAEISRDEMNFNKFVNQLRNQFKEIFDILLSTQLLLKGIISKEDWDSIRPKLQYKWAKDSYFSELKNLEMMRERYAMADAVETSIEKKYISRRAVRRTILQQTDEDIRLLDAEIEEEAKEHPELLPDAGMGGMGGEEDLGAEPGEEPEETPDTGEEPPEEETPETEEAQTIQDNPAEYENPHKPNKKKAKKKDTEQAEEEYSDARLVQNVKKLWQ